MESDRKKKGAATVDDPAGSSDRSSSVRLNTTSERKAGGVSLDRATQTRIGDQLRAMYGELLEQPVPDRFRSLLAQLDGASKERRADDAGGDREASK